MFSYFDVNCMVGRSVLFQSSFVSVNRLIEEMDYYGIKEALVFHSLSKEYHPMVGNKELLKEIKVNDELHGCWVLLPSSHTKEMDSPEMIVKKMLRSGIRVVRLFPRSHFYKLSKWCMGDTLAILEKYRIPVLLDFETEHPYFDTIDWEAVAKICLEYPDLPVVLMQVGLRTNRMFYPLLARYKNLSIDISAYWMYRGIESICKNFGANRILFGTGLPFYDPGFSLAMLSYSNIGAQEKGLIAGDNLRRLIAEVKVNEVI